MFRDIYKGLRMIRKNPEVAKYLKYKSTKEMLEDLGTTNTNEQ